jgi:hypothetical protein
VKELAAKLDAPMQGVMTAECTIALCVQLLRALGVASPSNAITAFLN